MSVFIPLVCAGLLLSGLAHLLLPNLTEKHMSKPVNVRIAGAILIALMLPAVCWGFYILAIGFALFGLPRLLTPDRSIRLQQRLYSRRVHGVVLIVGAAGLWMVTRHL